MNRSSVGQARIAIVDQLGNPGGGSRFLRALLIGFRRVRPDVSVTLLCNGAALAREGVLDEYRREGVTVVELEAVRPPSMGVSVLRRSVAKLARTSGLLRSALEWMPERMERSLERELRLRLHGFDVAHFWWPYGVSPPDTVVPLSGTFHDFNFRYAFQTPTFSVEALRRLNGQTEAWIRRCSPIVSSQFMYDEFMSLYPQAPKRPAVLRLPMNPSTSRAGSGSERLSALGVRRPYVLYPANTCAHKNLGAAVASHAVLMERGLDHQLVLTGPGTDTLVGEACPLGMVRLGGAGNVLGLGYVSNEDMDSLLDNATVVISTSLYEAGNGPGLDAWMRGIPVAMSDISSFTEHFEVHGVEAAVFDPTSPREIADVLEKLLRDPEEASRRAERSRAAIRKVDELRPARLYLDKLLAIAQGKG